MWSGASQWHCGAGFQSLSLVSLGVADVFAAAGWTRIQREELRLGIFEATRRREGNSTSLGKKGGGLATTMFRSHVEQNLITLLCMLYCWPQLSRSRRASLLPKPAPAEQGRALSEGLSWKSRQLGSMQVHCIILLSHGQQWNWLTRT